MNKTIPDWFMAYWHAKDVPDDIIRDKYKVLLLKYQNAKDEKEKDLIDSQLDKIELYTKNKGLLKKYYDSIVEKGGELEQGENDDKNNEQDIEILVIDDKKAKRRSKLKNLWHTLLKDKTWWKNTGMYKNVLSK